jgi:hypothetical protein
MESVAQLPACGGVSSGIAVDRRAVIWSAQAGRVGHG